MTDPTGVTTYVYDLLRRLTRTRDAFGATVTYGYDASGNRTLLGYPDGTSARSTYDAADRLVSITDSVHGATSYAYDAVGNETAATFANGTRSAKRYDALDRLTQQTTLGPRGARVLGLAYTYDALGNITSERGGAEDEDSALGYAYDALSRLVSVRGDDARTTYRYDPVGNRTGVSGGDDAHSAVFDAADQLTTLAGTGGEIRLAEAMAE